MSDINSFLRVRKITEALTAPLELEDFVAQPVVDVSPPKWHLGHTTWFFENFILVNYLDGYKLFNEQFPFVFNSYYESQGERILRNKRGTLTRPSTAKIFEYRSYVDQHMEKLFAQEKEIPAKALKFFEIGLNHEQQHQELLLTDIKYILGTNPIPAAYKNRQKAIAPIINEEEWLAVEEGVYKVGHEGNSFCFDNELGAHQVFLAAFEARSQLVSNKEYLEFINDGGYARPELWLSEGWDWVQQNEAKAPFFWFMSEGEWNYYTLSGVSEIELNEPVTHINFYEADAFARWAGNRLLTEFEWEVLCQKFGKLEEGNFQNTQLLHPNFNGKNQLLGNLWEWTNSAYLPYPHYQQEEGALGEYNGKFMVNQMVLRGGSIATPKGHIRPTYRNFFHPHLQWQFTGIRLARYT